MPPPPARVSGGDLVSGDGLGEQPLGGRQVEAERARPHGGQRHHLPQPAWPVSTSTAKPAWAAAWAVLAIIMTWWRGNRSAKPPPTGRTTTTGTRPAASTYPTSAAEPPLPSTANGIATAATD